jgi:ankyrin repeat protein
MNRINQELIVAAGENNPSEVYRLLRAGADVNSKNNDGFTPLHEASWNGHVQVAIELIGLGPEIHANDSNGATSSTLGKRKSRGANIEAKDNDGDTPLHFAIFKGHLAVVKALLSGGADIFAANIRGKLPIHYAVIRGNSAVTKCLFQHFYQYSTICGWLPLHELLEDLTWIVNPYSSGVPLLREALDENLLGTDDVVEILEYLVERNPELLSSRDQDGLLPLHVACRRAASFTIVQSLVNLSQISIKHVTSQGDLPLFLACEMPETSLDTIFILMKLYPDLVYR